jgi:hypothetical protein
MLVTISDGASASASAGKRSNPCLSACSEVSAITSAHVAEFTRTLNRLAESAQVT